MALQNTHDRYGFVAKAFHWGMAALIVFSWGLGAYMTDLEGLGEKFFWYQVHKSWGFVIFCLALTRIGWRLAGPVPAMPAHMGAVERRLAHCGHGALYVLMIAIPVTGWLMSSANTFGIPTEVFGLFALPHPVGPSKELEDQFRSAHEVLGNLLALVLLGHVAAALKHHYWNRDDVLRRMLPRSGDQARP